jgi:hypothetical protein
LCPSERSPQRPRRRVSGTPGDPGFLATIGTNLDVVLGLAGFALLACGLTRLARGSMAEGISAAGDELLLPGALTVTVLPFVFALALYAAYESTFARVRIMTRNETSTWEVVRGRLAITAALHFRVRQVGRLSIAISLAGCGPASGFGQSSFCGGIATK